MTLNEYSSFMNDQLHLLEVAGKANITEEQKKLIFAKAFGEDKVKDALKEYPAYIKKKKEENSNARPGVRDFLVSKGIKQAKAQELIKQVIGDQHTSLKDKYEAAKKAYNDKIEAIKKGLDIENINKEIDSLTNAAAQLNMPPEKVKSIKTRNGEFRRTAGMVLEGIGAILSAFPGLEGLAQIAGGLGAVSTKYGNKAAEEAAKEAENFDKNKQVLSQAGINSKEEYETILNNIIANDLVGLKSYFNKVNNSNNLTQLEKETTNASLNEAVTSTYKPEDLANIDISNVEKRLEIENDDTKKDTYKKNLKWRTDPNYNGNQKYKLDLTAKKYLSDLISTKNFEKINELKGNVQQPQPQPSEVPNGNQ